MSDRRLAYGGKRFSVSRQARYGAESYKRDD
jgi:hypothetical protein